MADSFEELGNALEELYMAVEQLRQQNQELTSARLAIETERQRYQDLFEFAPDAYLVTDAKGMIQEVNRTAAALLNMLQQYLVGKELLAFVQQSDRPAFRSHLSQIHQVKQV